MSEERARPLVLFGCGKIAEVVLHVLRHRGDREVVACSVDRDFLPGPTWKGLPTVALDEVAERHPPATHDAFVALGYQDMNGLRAARCAALKAMGYRLPSVVHPDAGLPSDTVHGDNCFFMDRVLVHPCVRFGDDVFVWSGAMVGHHSQVGSHCWLTSCANLAGSVTVGEQGFFAVNATVTQSVTLGARVFVGANALVTRDAADDQVYLAESSKPFRLDSRQFLRMSRFDEV